MSVATARQRAQKKAKAPSYADRIAALVKKKQRISGKRAEAEQIVQSFQRDIDQAEANLSDLFVGSLLEPTEKSTLAESDARVARDALVKQHLVAKERLKQIPKSIDILNTEIRVLSGERDGEIKKIVDKKISELDVDKAADEATQALARYCAVIVMSKTRQIGYASSASILNTLTKNKAIDPMMVEEFYKLEKKLGVLSI